MWRTGRTSPCSSPSNGRRARGGAGPGGGEGVWCGGGPLAEAAQGSGPSVVADLAASPAWGAVGLATGSAMVAPVRTEAGLWAILEVWSDFRDAFAPQDVRLLARVAQALGRKTPAA